MLVYGDRIAEENICLVNLGNATFAQLTSNQVFGTIQDDEPYVSIESVSQVEGNTGTTSYTFTVTLSAASDLPVSVNFATADSGATLAGGITGRRRGR